MKKIFLALLLISPMAQATVWHIRHDGGNNTQCTGTTNAAYPGSGTGVACAYNHPFQMLAFSGAWAALAAGDTIEFDDPTSNTTPYYMGEQNAGVGQDWNAQVGGVCGPPNSLGTDCHFPGFPNNITIKGQSYGSCHNTFPGGLNHPTILSGINNTFWVLNVGGTNGMTVSCIEITQPDNCTNEGAGFGPGQCATTAPASNAVHGAALYLETGTNQGPANFTLTDFAAIGTADRGIQGSHLNLLSTDTFTGSDIYIIGNGAAGWDGDGGGCNNSCESVGTMNVNHLDVELNGCLSTARPYDWTKTPVANTFNYCYGQNTSGYGDGFVQIAAGTGYVMNITNSIFKYNTQDGLDAAHLSDDPTTNPVTNVSGSWSEGNAGQTFKIGAGVGSHASAINNVSISNCHILDNPAAFPLNVSGWTTLDAGDTCRAGGDQWALTIGTNTTNTLENNTSVGYGSVMYDLECSQFVANCNGASIVFKNNVSKGYPDPANSGILAAGIYLGNPGTSIPASQTTVDHNLWNTMKAGTACPNNALPGETNAVCSDPLLVAESNIDAINPNLTSSSPAINAGTTPCPTADYNGTAQTSPCTLGALVFNGGSPTVATPTASPVAGTYTSTQNVTLSTVTGGASIVYTTDGTTPTVTALTCTITHGTLYSGALTVATTQTINAIGCESGFNASSVFTGTYTITVATPTASPVAGTYTSTQSVALSTTTAGATICYTTDGSTPTATTPGTCSHGTTYSTAITVAVTTTINAIGTLSGDTNSSLFTGVYTINPVTTVNFNGYGTINMQGTVHIP